MQINNAQELDIAIATLESKKVLQEKALKLQFNETVESFKPKNLIKAAYNNAMEGTGVGASILKAASGVGATVLGGKLLGGNSVLSKLAGTALNAGAADGILNNKDKIVAWGTAIYKNLFAKK
jgi:hypothetical protein